MTKSNEKAKHPSGIECNDIAKHLGFYLGSAVMHLWRMHEKHVDLLPDLKKAAFYVSEYITGYIEQRQLPVELPKVGGNAFSDAKKKYNEDVQRLITMETDGTAGVFWALVLQNPANIQSLQTALAVIQNRIAAEDKAPAWCESEDDAEEGPSERPSFVDDGPVRNIRGPEYFS